MGAVVFRIGWGPLHGRPILSSKVNTLLQLVYVLMIIVRAAVAQPPQSVLDALAVVTLGTILVSGFGYLREFTARALQIAARPEA